VGRGAFELRLKEHSGVYRVIYALIRGGRVDLVHAFKKTTRATLPKNIEIARKRLKEILR
jgi:phage-related protein